MIINFYKYQGAGNDFILIDGFDQKVKLSAKQIARLCNRNFGIGADGLMVLKPHPKVDFEMEYYNSDGKLGSMCGNGGRCIVLFAHDKKRIKKNNTRFLASDGLHEAILLRNAISLKMIDVTNIEYNRTHYFLNTGSPHFVKFVPDVDLVKVVENGRKIRYNKRFANTGTNVNFVEEVKPGFLKVRTYERGVENETLACGTGVTAAAICYALANNFNKKIRIETPGGKLQVSFLNQNRLFKEIWLTGPAKLSFSGKIEL